MGALHTRISVIVAIPLLHESLGLAATLGLCLSVSAVVFAAEIVKSSRLTRFTSSIKSFFINVEFTKVTSCLVHLIPAANDPFLSQFRLACLQDARTNKIGFGVGVLSSWTRRHASFTIPLKERRALA